MEPLESPFEKLPEDLAGELEYIADMKLYFAETPPAKDDPNAQEVAELTKELTKQGVDVELWVDRYKELVDEINRRNALVVKELDGRKVKIPGYALPLEYIEEKVSEFLLVPYVGACIHTTAAAAQSDRLRKNRYPYFL